MYFLNLLKGCVIMFKIENLGNIELYDTFLAVQIRIWHAFKHPGYTEEDFQIDPRKYDDDKYLPKNFLKEQDDLYLTMLNNGTNFFSVIYGVETIPEDSKYDVALYMFLDYEISKRGFDINDSNSIFTMMDTPTYIRETPSIAAYGDQPINSVYSFDYPVRKACKILARKGYISYWSSANREDAFERYGHAVKGKHVGYILIDPKNLTDDLKKELFLDGKCDFWGLALAHADNEKYYGIWAEITSPNMKCDDLSDALSEKALALPDLIIKQEHHKK